MRITVYVANPNLKNDEAKMQWSFWQDKYSTFTRVPKQASS